MPKFAELGLTTEQVGADINYAEIPDQMGSFQPPPQPGKYRLRFPARMDDLWEAFDYDRGVTPGKRLRAKFDDAHPFTIIQAPPQFADQIGLPFTTTLSNAERKRGKSDDASAPYVSDMDYILRDVLGVATKPKTNVQYAQEFQKLANTEMGVTITWRWGCNKERNIYTDNGQGGLMEVEQKGCGTNYYEKDVQKVLSNPEDPASLQVFPLRITCACGANLRAFPGLQNFTK